jgi:Zn-dependent protease
MNLLSFKAGTHSSGAKREGKWRFKLHLAGLLTPGGAVGAVSKDLDQPRWEEILMIAAGPLANLLIGVPAIYAVLHDDWPHYQQSWELIAFTASFCVIAAVLNLVPLYVRRGGHTLTERASCRL